MSVLITGASGFIGKSLAAALLGSGDLKALTLTDLIEPPSPVSRRLTDTSFSRTEHPKTKVNLIGADLTSENGVKTVLDEALEVQPLTLVYILHGLMSGDSEKNHDLSIRVNLDATRNLLLALQTRCPGVRIVYTSSCAVYGPQDQDTHGNKVTKLTENTKTIPTGTYGAHKAMMEIFIDDMSRRGAVDARIVRLPTIIVRAGKPTGAASSFASGMFREPLQGIKSVVPVRKDLEIWICSARTVVRNLIIAGQLEATVFGQGSRVVLLPGRLVTVQDMVNALEHVGGEKAVQLIEMSPDEKVEQIVEGWATRIDDGHARRLGFVEDGTLDSAVTEFIEDYLSGET
ncbi:MAG: hypothetical protein GOMPHAMPRED_003770 [Gomphillus americanus]|uniref:NAD-dependent epimerase/dehydratase domain-containing protein n=1 Tax=Gomphillus americanus TaxID=1940652 RepID=A0A8H3FLC6_9LECA|nr:MAG: hypothetical protein GOMPHAMPRED_003770 [Gomphillus americanus]